jgi:acyl-CoA synthetase (NDP forming)
MHLKKSNPVDMGERSKMMQVQNGSKILTTLTSRVLGEMKHPLSKPSSQAAQTLFGACGSYPQSDLLSAKESLAVKSSMLPKIQFGQTTAAQAISSDVMDKLMKPKGIVLVGASEAQGAVGKEVLDNLVKGGYTGQIYLINPKYQGQTSSVTVPGANGQPPAQLTYLASADQLPANKVDMAVVMTPSRTVPGIVEGLGQKGVKSVVLISAGFKETGPEGAALEQQLQTNINRHGMVLVGPNCVGIANPASDIKMNATFVQGKPLAGKGALVSQSGAVGIDIMSRAGRLGLGVSQFVSIGNAMQIDANKMMRYWKEDPSVKYVMGYLESVQNPDEFREIVKSLSKEKPVLFLKSGKSQAGAKAASSHTGSLAGSDHAVDALFKQTGVQRMDSIQQLFAAAQAFENTKPSVGNRVGIYSNAGGYAVLATDLLDLERYKLQLAQLTPQTEESLKAFLPAAASRKNPVDTTATVPADSLEKYKQALNVILDDPNVDSLVVSIVPLMGIQPGDIAQAVAEAQQRSHKPVVGMISCGEDEFAKIQTQLKSKNLPPVALYTSMEDAVSGLGALEAHRTWVNKAQAEVVPFTDVDKPKVTGILATVKAEGRKLLTTTESLDVLNAYGINTPKWGLTQNLDEAKATAAQLGYPLVIKLCSKTISHKTEVGGVILDIRNEEQLEKAFTELQSNLRKHNVSAFKPGEGILVQQFLNKGREVIMGLNDDPQFGKMLMMGFGGIYAEVFKDVQFRLNPITKQDVGEMLDGMKSSKILKGYRGKPGADLETVEEVMLRLSQLVSDFPELTELDINPYMAQPKPTGGGKGGSAVDARIIIK